MSLVLVRWVWGIFCEGVLWIPELLKHVQESLRRTRRATICTVSVAECFPCSGEGICPFTHANQWVFQ